MFSIDSKDFTIASAARITVRDCPYCGSFDCCGDCEEALAAEAERLTDAEVMEEVDSCRGQADTSIMYQPA